MTWGGVAFLAAAMVAGCGAGEVPRAKPHGLGAASGPHDAVPRPKPRAQAVPAMAPAGLGLRLLPAEARPLRNGCGYDRAVRLAGFASGAEITPAPTVTLALAKRIAAFEREVVQPAARAHFGRPVVAMRNVSSYACRNVGGSGRRSAHARARALDIAGFTLEGGARITVLDDWSGSGPKSAFLRAVHKGACDHFRTVLGPAYNRAHRDHFHFDIGRHGGICR